MSESNEALAARLKAEGNALFTSRKYKEAESKYTEGLKADPTNVLLLGNRAACWLNLKRYSDAVEDAKKATEIDPTYAKGYARMATAYGHLDEPRQSEAAWRKAVNALAAKETLSDAEKKQKAEYEANLKVAQQNTAQTNVFHVKANEKHKTPWEIASQRFPQWEAAGKPDSCIPVIYNSYQSFKEAMSTLKQVKRQGPAVIGWQGTVQDLTNCITTDRRIFHLEDPNFINLWNLQVEFQLTSVGAATWTSFGPRDIQRVAPEILRSEGWGAFRPRVTSVVRIWIFTGFIMSQAFGDETKNVKCMSEAVEVIRWVRSTYPNVEEGERGTIFTSTFLRSVVSLLLDGLTGLYMRTHEARLLERMKTESEWMLNDIQSDPTPTPTGYSLMHLVFTRYVKSTAHATLAVYHSSLANKQKKQKEKEEGHYKAALCFMDAGSCLPEDELDHAYYYACAVNSFRSSGRIRIKPVLEALEKVRISKPKVEEIWEVSMGHKAPLLAEVIEVGDVLKEQMASGKVTAEDELAFGNV